MSAYTAVGLQLVFTFNLTCRAFVWFVTLVAFPALELFDWEACLYKPYCVKHQAFGESREDQLMCKCDTRTGHCFEMTSGSHGVIRIKY